MRCAGRRARRRAGKRSSSSNSPRRSQRTLRNRSPSPSSSHHTGNSKERNHLRERSTGAAARSRGTHNAKSAVDCEQLHPVAVTPARVREDTIVQQVLMNSLDVEDHRKMPTRGLGVLSEAADMLG